MTLLERIDAAQRWAIMTVMALALVSAAGFSITKYGASRYAAGRESVTAGVRVDTVTVNVIRRADSTAKAATDGAAKRTKATARRVDTLIRAVPDSLIAVPAIKALVGSVKQLTSQVDTLTRTLDVERAVSRLRASTDSAALVSALVVIEAKEDQIVALKKRPQWRTVAAVGTLAFVAGLLK